MQLQQNLFSIYRLILRTPKYIFLSALLFLIVIATVQIIFVMKQTPQLQLSQCMFDYIIEKYDRKGNQTAISSNSSSELLVGESNETKLEEIELVEDGTILNIVVGKTSSCNYQIDYDYVNDTDNLPLLKLTKVEYLAYIKNKTKTYFQAHKITHDKLIIPPLQLSTPSLTYFFQQDMQKNEYLLSKVRDQIFKLDKKIGLHILNNNITNMKFVMRELYASYYYQNEGEFQKTFNFLQYISLKAFNELLLKFIYGIGTVMIMYLLSIFVGLLIRYTLFTFYTVFLLIYDRCMTESWGWVHQYLLILYARLRQNYWATVKFLVFYFFSNIGMNGLLAFGSYCVIKKLFYPMLPLPIDSYSTFLFKSLFFVELFLYMCCRSRVALRFFPLFSIVSTFLSLTFIAVQEYGSIMMILNIHLTFQLIFFTIFLLIEQIIQADNEKGLSDEYCPSMNKPRMMFYAGYDVGWEKSMPPIWTYFTNWFDYSYFSEAEKSLIQKDYQLLYGRMLGLNQRQELPDEEEEGDQSGRSRLNDQPSNEMNLIQNDL